MEGAHSSIVDARAQLSILKDNRFQKYQDKTKSIVLLEEVWAEKRKAALTRMGWVENMNDLPQSAVLLDAKIYDNSAEGRAVRGPTSKARDLCRGRSLSDLFLLFWPIDLLKMIADETNRYGIHDWVRPAEKKDNFYSEEDCGDSSASNSDNSDFYLDSNANSVAEKQSKRSERTQENEGC